MIGAANALTCTRRACWPVLALLWLPGCAPEPEPQGDSEPVDTAPVDTGTPWSWCGDGTTDTDEGCDDGNVLGGDGCSSTCTAESGAPESEPNDTVADATALTDLGGELDGGLPSGDVDCWSFTAAPCDAIQVEQVAPCTSALGLALYAADGAALASGGIDAEGCVAIDPGEAPGARWVAAGDYVVCAYAIAAATVPDYALTITTSPSDPSWPVSDADIDGDGVPPTCDDDRDGDGVGNDDDTCPDLSNGPDSSPLAVDSAGYITDWLTAGPFVAETSTDTCRPNETASVGEDAALAPTLGDAAGTSTWVAALDTGEILDFTLDYGTISAPREAYAFVYLTSPTARTLTLSVGADDGMFAWWNGVKVLDVNSCQGVYGDPTRWTATGTGLGMFASDSKSSRSGTLSAWSAVFRPPMEERPPPHHVRLRAQLFAPGGRHRRRARSCRRSRG